MRNLLKFFTLLSVVMIVPVVSSAQEVMPARDNCDNQAPGDADGDGGVDIEDVRFIENYLRTMKPHNQESMSHLDVDADCDIDCDDVDYLRSYLFDSGPFPLHSHCRLPKVDTCCWQRPGDAIIDNFIDISDAIYVLNYLLDPDSVTPLSMANMDANGNCVVSIEDVKYILDYCYQVGPHPVTCTCLEPATIRYAGCHGICGDVNCDESIDLSDAVYLVSYLYNDGPPPCPVMACGDVNGSSSLEVDIQDLMFIINFAVSGGIAPDDCSYEYHAWYPEPACCPYKSSE